MAIKKEIELDNGIITNYHRITSINKITNDTIIIEVSSYTSEVKRQEETRYQELQKKQNRTTEEQEELEKGINVYIDTDYISVEYSESSTIKDLYEYLKSTEKFKGAEDC